MNVETLNKKVKRKDRYEKVEFVSSIISLITFIAAIFMTIAAIISKNIIVVIIAAVCLCLFVISFILARVNEKEKNREITEIINGPWYDEIEMKNSEIEEMKFLKEFYSFPDTYLKGPCTNKNVIIIAVWNSLFEKDREIQICSISIEDAKKIFKNL